MLPRTVFGELQSGGVSPRLGLLPGWRQTGNNGAYTGFCEAPCFGASAYNRDGGEFCTCPVRGQYHTADKCLRYCEPPLSVRREDSKATGADLARLREPQFFLDERILAVRYGVPLSSGIVHRRNRPYGPDSVRHIPREDRQEALPPEINAAVPQCDRTVSDLPR
jgi:hypothetical protein